MENLKLCFRRRLLFLVTLVSLTMILIVSSSVLADTVGPSITGVYPAKDAVISVSKITVSLTAKDQDNLVASSVVMKLDNIGVQPITEYGWIDEWTDDYTTLSIYYPATLSNGVHNMEVSVADGVGNKTTYIWSFVVGQPPKITSVSPVDGTVVTDRRPIVSAVISGGSLDLGSITMNIDGSQVPTSFDAITGQVTYIPTSDMSNESSHIVSLAARDTSGNSAQAQWKFTVNTYTDMTFSVDDNTCQKCHQRTSHPMNNCGKCHGLNLDPVQPVYPLDNCYRCHYNSNTFPAAYHTGGLPVSMQPDHPVRTTDSCVECHTKNWGPSIPAYHNVTNTANRHITSSTGCTTCHATSLTREHQRRTDSSGSALTCFTCHGNPDVRVQTAISTKNTACSACHSLGTTGGHPAHSSGLDSNCQTCHSDSILTEPQFHRQNGCQICHSAGAGDIVKYSISTKNTNCFSCHSEGHNVNFVQKVPADISQYPGFAWSVPLNAAIWAGEPWFTADYASAGAKIIISNRLQSVSGTEVNTWYDQNMADNGWAKTSGSVQGADNFTATYSKGNRMATVNFYGGENHDPSSRFIGYRLEVLYK